MEYSQIYASRIRALYQKRGISTNKLTAISGIKQSTPDNIMRAFWLSTLSLLPLGSFVREMPVT